MKNQISFMIGFSLFLLAQIDFSCCYVKLGCNIYSDGFDLYHASRPPVWASSETGSLHIEQNNWKTFLEDLTDIINDIDYKGKYENILDFVSFFKYYENEKYIQSNKSFSDIFESYDTKISLRSSEYRKTIDILETFSYKLTENYDDTPILKSLYLGSGLLAPPADLLNYIKNQKPGEEPIVKHYLHVPGVIKFTLGEEKRPGFILIGAKKDAKNGPIVVMKDEEEPDTKFTQYGEVQLDFQVWKENEDYIISQRKDDKNNTIDIIFNVAKPYCSVVDTSFKYNLLAPIKGLVEKAENEKYQGLYVDLSAKEHIVTLLKSDGQKKEIELSKFKTKEEELDDEEVSKNTEENDEGELEVDNELEDNQLSKKTEQGEVEGDEVSNNIKEKRREENDPERLDEDDWENFYGKRNIDEDEEEEEDDDDDDEGDFDEYFYERSQEILGNQKVLPVFDNEKEKFLQEINDELDSDEIIDDFLNDKNRKDTDYQLDDLEILKQIHLKVLLSELEKTVSHNEFLSELQDFAQKKIPLIRESLNIDKVGKHFDHFLSAIERRDKYFFSTLN